MTILLMAGSAMTVCAANAATFNYKAYADAYPDLKATFGYDANALYQHYITAGQKEGRVGTFTDGSTADTAASTVAATEQMDPLPPLELKKQAAWYGKLTPPQQMSNARLVAEYEAIGAWINADFYNRASDSSQIREMDLSCEIGTRVSYLDRYNSYLESIDNWSDYPTQVAKLKKELNEFINGAGYQHATSTDTSPLKKWMR